MTALTSRAATPKIVVFPSPPRRRAPLTKPATACVGAPLPQFSTAGLAPRTGKSQLKGELPGMAKSRQIPACLLFQAISAHSLPETTSTNGLSAIGWSGWE